MTQGSPRASLRTRWISAMRSCCCVTCSDPGAATPQQIDAAAWSTVPNVLVLFWSFRFMVAIGFLPDCALRHGLLSRESPSPWRRSVGSCAWRSGVCRCRGSPPSSAGSSPSTAASRGRSMACCRPSSAHPRCRRAKVWLSLDRLRGLLLGARRGRCVSSRPHDPSRAGRSRLLAPAAPGVPGAATARSGRRARSALKRPTCPTTRHCG